VPFADVHTAFGQTLNGTFTLWVRRELKTAIDGMRDNVNGEEVVMVAEGQAPFSVAMAGAGADFRTANRAVRRLELKVTVREGCKPSSPQASQTGFSGCETLP
ncbi:MAG TPA: hypothetical protein VFO85_13320, partial [Vicinamibacteria bacterium]|nr:hypothetical protein [Vicinamibacteria bacterium]